MKKICIVTAARSEYGYLKYMMSQVMTDPALELQLVVTGGHLLDEQGLTVNQIYKDGFSPAKVIDAQVDNSSSYNITKTMSRLGSLFSDAFSELVPDAVVVLGDRYELLPICSTAYMQGIPIAHICGGDVTEGAVDDGVRNAVTMLATYHFPSNQDSADNIIRMRNSRERVYVTGSPSLDIFTRTNLLSRQELAANLELDLDRQWILLTYHPETKITTEENISVVSAIMSVLLGTNYFIVMTKANADLGGKEINVFLSKTAERYPEKCKLYSSLGQINYVSMMRQVSFVIGNSSSGILETPFWETPTVNIGNRQHGRFQCGNIVQSGSSKSEIEAAVERVKEIRAPIHNKFYWGNGNASVRIVNELKKELER